MQRLSQEPNGERIVRLVNASQGLRRRLREEFAFFEKTEQERRRFQLLLSSGFAALFLSALVAIRRIP